MRLAILILALTLPLLTGMTRIYTVDGKVYNASDVKGCDIGICFTTQEGVAMSLASDQIKRMINPDGSVLRLNEDLSGTSWHVWLMDADGFPTEEAREAVRAYLLQVLHDPDSYQGVSWGKVYKKKDLYVVPHEYRAKNLYGALKLDTTYFYFDVTGTIRDHRKS